MRNFLRILHISVLGLGLLTNVAAHADTGAATKSVETLHAALLAAMKQGGEQAGYKGRYTALEPVITKCFDFGTIAKLVLGRNWAGLNPEQQKKFVETFAKLSVATYASRFDSFSGEHFESLGETKQSGNNMLVNTQLVRTNDQPVSLNYLVSIGQDGSARILNVVADGVSDISLKRSEYGSIISSDGFDALIEKLNAKIAQYESPSSK
ncbi:MAG: ABC transporter substrate-binding protein [Gammaproteobacteria bacterium]